MLQKGLTLVELMISMVLGLLLTAGIMTLFVQSQQSYAATRDIAILDQNAQVFVDLVEFDLQRVGYAFGCRPDKAARVVNIAQLSSAGGASLPSIVDDTKIAGYSKTATNEVKDSVLAGIDSDIYDAIQTGSDYFMMMVGNPERQGRVQTSTATGSSFTAVFEREQGNLDGQIIYMTTPDCDQVSQFVQTDTTTASALEVSNISPAQAVSSINPVRNCSNQILGRADNCSDTSALASGAFPTGGNIMIVEYLGYALNNDNQLVRINALATDSAVPLLNNVSAFSIEWGLSTEAASVQNGVRSVNLYATAQEIAASSALNWSQAIAMKLDFTLQGDISVNGQPFEKRYSRVMTLRNEVIN